MIYFCAKCAPENIDDFHFTEQITGICEEDACQNLDYPVDQMPVRGYELRESAGGEA